MECATILEAAPATDVKLIILVTDGEDNVRPYGSVIAPQLKASNHLIGTFGVGPFANELELPSMASAPQLYYKFANFDDFEASVASIVSSFCFLPAAAAPSPTPSITPTPRPLAPPTITSLDQVGDFVGGEDESSNLESLREGFEYYAGEGLGFDTNMRISASLQSSSDPNFPWNIVGERFRWKGQSQSPTPGPIDPTIGRQVELVPPDEMIDASEKAISACPARSCAAQVSIVSAKFVKFQIIRNALALLQKRPGFTDVFSAAEQEKFRVVREGGNKFTVFVPFKDRVSGSEI